MHKHPLNSFSWTFYNFNSFHLVISSPARISHAVVIDIQGRNGSWNMHLTIENYETCIVSISDLPREILLRLPLFSRSPFQILQLRKKRMYDRMQISFSLCISVMWIRCPVSSHRCTRVLSFFLSSPVQKRGTKGSMSVYFIFSNIYHAKKDTLGIEHASSDGGDEKENHFSSRKTASNVQEALFFL
jgi:hypothetical protein